MIIFDLDDTLIDTSGCITPFKLRAVLRRWMDEGLVVGDLEKAYRELLEINGKSLKSKDAICAFAKRLGVGERAMRLADEEMKGPLPKDFVIETTPYAKEILNDLARGHRLALVTGGHPPLQMEKLEKAGIDRGFFSKIAIPEDSVKKPFYQGLVEEFSVPATQVWVCGDRIAMDLVPAFELGFTTVHMRWGRGSIVETETWVHHAISDLRELKRIIKP